MAEASLSPRVSSSLKRLRTAIRKQAEEKQFWFDNLAEYADWLRKHVHAIESYVGSTLLQIEAEALATAMRKADERQHRYKTAVGDALVELRELKQTVEARDEQSRSSTDDEQLQADSRSLSIDGDAGSFAYEFADEETAINDMLDRRVRRQAQRAKRVLKGDLGALEQSKLARHNRCKVFIRQADRQVRAALTETRKLRVETWKTRSMFETLVEVEKGTKTLDKKVADEDFYQVYGFERVEAAFDQHSMPQTKSESGTGTKSKRKDAESFLWHRPTGKMCAVSDKAKQHLEETLDSYYATETDQYQYFADQSIRTRLNDVLSSYYATEAEQRSVDRSSGSRLSFDVEVSRSCYVENLGIVCLYNQMKSDAPLITKTVGLIVFDEDTGELLAEPKLFAADSKDGAIDCDYFWSLRSTRSGRFIVFDYNSGIYREYAVDNDASSSRSKPRRIRLRSRFVITKNDGYSSAKSFCVNGRVCHAVVKYENHAVLIATEPRPRIRAIIDTRKSINNKNMSVWSHNAISDDGLCLFLVEVMKEIKIHFYDLNGVAIRIACMSDTNWFSPFYSYFVCCAANRENFAFAVIQMTPQTNKDEVKYVRFQSVVKHSEMAESRPRESISRQKIADITHLDAFANPKKPPLKAFRDRDRVIFAPVSKCFYSIEDWSKIRVYNGNLSSNSDSSAPHFRRIFTGNFEKSQRITGLCALGADWVVAVLNNAFLVTIEVRSGEVVNTVRFSRDENHHEALISSADPTRVYVSHQYSNTVAKLECGARVFDWQVVHHRTFARSEGIRDMFYDKYSSRLALLSHNSYEENDCVRICGENLQVVKTFDCGSKICGPIICFYKSLLVFLKNNDELSFYSISTSAVLETIYISLFSLTFHWVESIDESDEHTTTIAVNLLLSDAGKFYPQSINIAVEHQAG